MINLDEINTVYFDVLKEIGNIGAGNATTALAKMLDMKIDMKVPNVQLLEFKDLAAVISSEDEPVMGILLEVESDIAGSMMFFLELDSAHYLVNKLMMRDPDSREEFTEMDLSALKEIGNIIAGSYLSALSSLTNMTITSSIPYLCIDMAGAILSVPAIEFGKYGDKALLIQTEFGDDVKINGYFILLPELDSYEKILSSLGIQL
ncbi:MAG: chemotaxis protein CheC [Lachnospiraceae bacterium]|jgi:chemotaxis protein CheC|nr:chemotaxis protein CheC [Lachnospiraceae bacterium]MBR4808404.1 chemotaxis protein CheC [Lachnospiraceae bacterium]